MPSPSTASCKVDSPALTEARQSAGCGCGWRASALLKAARIPALAGRALASTGKARRNLPSSGMHSFSHTTQSASASRTSWLPGRASRGTVRVIGNTISFS